MNRMLINMRSPIRLLLAAVVVASFFGWPSAAVAVPPPFRGSQAGQSWSFGIIADTQWTVADDGYNPNTVAANIIKQLDQQFIKAGVKFVVAMGDTVDIGSKASIDTRALYAQDLYNAGIAFFPLRGNHEAAEDPNYPDSGPELRYAFPQIGTGINNNTPAAITTAIISPTDLLNNPPAQKTGSPFTVGTNFSEPTAVNAANKSISYSFRYDNATFMLLDQFNRAGNYYSSTIPDQQQWINDTLATRPANTHAFVFSHKNVLGGNHKDSLLGGPIVPVDPAAGKDPGDGNGMDTTKLTPGELAALTAKQATMNAFEASLQAHKVDYLITAHDHHHLFSIITSPDGQSQIRQLICASDSSKFYTPVAPFSANDVPVEQDLGRVGYYIFTVDGPRVTIDYYGDITGGNDYGLNGGTFSFVKISSTTYSLNGTANQVAQGASYALNDNTTVAASMEPGFKGTSAAILAGTNTSVTMTNYGKKVVQNVTSGWTAGDESLASDILHLGGMSRSLGSAKTSEYTLSISYIPGSAKAEDISRGKFGLLARSTSGCWVKAEVRNYAINSAFVLGPWNSSYKLGTYGVDTATHTAWAVVNYSGDFTVGLPSVPTVNLPLVCK